MIELGFNGRPVYANVYVHTKGQLTYHIDFIGESLPEFLRDTIVLVHDGDRLKPLVDGLPQIVIKKIIDSIDRHFT